MVPADAQAVLDAGWSEAALFEAIEVAGYSAGKQVWIALDVAATELYDEDKKPSKFGKGLFIGMAFTAGAGSIITLLGAARGGSCSLSRRASRSRVAAAREQFATSFGSCSFDEPREDLRGLDWNLYARLDKPFVRVTRREAGEAWAVAVAATSTWSIPNTRAKKVGTAVLRSATR